MRKRDFMESVGIFLLFVGSHLPSLGHDIFNTDVWKWKARTFDFSSGIFGADFALTLQKYHPGVTLMWLGTFAIKVYSGYYKLILGINPPDNDISAIFQLHFLQKLFIVFSIGLTLVFVFYALRKMFGKRFALLAVILLMLEPFFIALTRVFHLEGLMSTFMLASFVWLTYYLRDNKFTKRLFFSAFFATLAFLTKTSSLFLIPFTGLLLFIEIYSKKKEFLASVKAALVPFLKWLGVVLLLFIALWPALWVIPQEVVQTLIRGVLSIGVEGGHEQLYFGKLVQDPGVSFYPLVLVMKSSPFLILSLVYLLVNGFKSLKPEFKKFVNYSLLFAGLYSLELIISSKKLDRYLLPSIMSLSLVSSVGIYQLLQKYKELAVKSLLLFVTIWLGFLYYIHPDYFSYFSPLTGGLRMGINIIEPKWIIGHHELTKYLVNYSAQEGLKTFSTEESFANSKDIENKLTVAFPEKYYTQVWPFIREIGGWAIIEDLTPEAKQTNIFVYPTWDDYSAEETRYKLEFIDSVRLRGVPVYNLYKRAN